MFTGKTPTHEIFKDGLSIYGFVAMAFPGNVRGIIDPSLLMAEGKQLKDDSKSSLIHNHFLQNATSRMEECLVSVLRIGLLCANPLPTNRMPMSIVVNKMQEIRDSYFVIN